LGNLYISILISGFASVLFGIVGSGLICALLLGLSAMTNGSVAVHDLRSTFTTVAVVLGGLVALFFMYEDRVLWRETTPQQNLKN
jgi:ABC-type glucose/galactose transport system permease subunit